MGMFGRKSRASAEESPGGGPMDVMPQSQLKAPAGGELARSGTTKHLAQRSAHDALQTKTFVRWWNAELPKGSSKIVDLSGDLTTGVAQLKLMRIMMGDDTILIKENPKTRFELIENQATFMAKMKELQIPMVNIAAEDLADGNDTLILGMTWKLISNFGGLAEQGAQELMAWIKANAQGYADGISITGEGMRDGKALCAILAAYDPTCIDMNSLPSDPTACVEKAFAVAEGFGAPRLIDAKDLVDNFEIKSLMTYVLKMQQALRAHAETRGDGTASVVSAFEASCAALGSDVDAATEKLKAMEGEAKGLEPGVKASIDKAEVLEKSLAAVVEGEKPGLLERRDKLSAEKDALIARLNAEASPFKHGPSLDERIRGLKETAKTGTRKSLVAAAAQGSGVSGKAIRSEEEVRAPFEALPPKFDAMEKAEAAMKSALYDVLTYKKTDMLVNDAAAKAAEVTKKTMGWAEKLKAVMFTPPGSLDKVQKASALLQEFSAVAAELQAEWGSVNEICSVALGRLAKEERPPPSPALDAALELASKEVQSAATEVRRQVAAGVKWQLETVAKLNTTWGAISTPLSDLLGEDPKLVEPKLPPEFGPQHPLAAAIAKCTGYNS